MKANKILLGTCLVGMLASSGAYAGFMCDWFGVWCDDNTSMNTQATPAPTEVAAPVAPAPAPAAPAVDTNNNQMAPAPVEPAPVAPAPSDVQAPAADNSAPATGDAGMMTDTGMPE